MSQQFRNKTEAQQAIQDMERREAINSHRGSKVCDERATQYRAEAARIRALLPNLPDEAPAVAWEETDRETVGDVTTRLSFSIRVF
jgi:hypothetical protein